MARLRLPRVHAGWIAAAAGAALAGWVAWTVFQPVAPRRTRRAVPGLDPEWLRVLVDQLATSFAPRDAAHADTLTAAGTWVASRLGEAGARVAPPLAGTGGVPIVVASLGPEDGPRAVVTARYDAAHDSPGAADAGALAALLGLARLLADTPPEARVDLVALADAGPRRQAAARHTLTLADAEVTAIVCLESLGCFDDAPGSQRYPGPVPDNVLPDRADFVALVGRFGEGRPVRRLKASLREASSVPVLSINGTAGLGETSHDEFRVYRRAHLPVVRVTDTGPWRNPRFGSPDDRPATLDYARLADVTAGLAHAVRTLATG